MSRKSAALLILAWAASFASAGETQPKVLLDLWDVAYIQGNRAGYVHTFVHEHEKDGTKLLRATVELRLTVKRFTEVIQLGMDTGTVESSEGRVVGVFM